MDFDDRTTEGNDCYSTRIKISTLFQSCAKTHFDFFDLASRMSFNSMFSLEMCS
jgi:hypothetical protein